MNSTQHPVATVYRNYQRGYIQPRCECGWKGMAYALNRPSIEMHDLAARDAKDHNYRHVNGLA